MDELLKNIAILVAVLCIINLLRMSLFLIGSDIYGLILHLRKRKRIYFEYPTLSVVIPAYNEEKSIIKCVSSVFESNYPKEKLEVIVVDDGSTDKTVQMITQYKIQNQLENFLIISQTNSGKAHALNRGMKKYSCGELVMCLDADSYLSTDALKKIAWYFQNEKVMAVASNVKIAKTKGVLNLIQLFEYIVCYQMKKAHNAFNIEYIIGGIGSTFRKSFLEKINYYDANTVTEDIDVTMKILQHGNKNVKIEYAADAIVYTQSVLSIGDFIKQRYRWKWGRYQTFLKNKPMFFSSHPKYTKGFTWFYLPYALLSDFFFLLEPVVILYIIFIIFYYNDLFTLVCAFIVVSSYITINILAEETTSFIDKLKLFLFIPPMYFLFYILSFVEYMALIKSLSKIHTLPTSITSGKYTWKPVERLGFISPQLSD